jgi:hypothetical protein
MKINNYGIVKKWIKPIKKWSNKEKKLVDHVVISLIVLYGKIININHVMNMKNLLLK